MAPLIIAALYGLMYILMKMMISLEMSNEVRLLFNIIGAISALIVPIAIYSFIDVRLTRRAINQVGQKWCLDQNVEFHKVERYKNHFALIYKESGKNIRKKFRVRFTITTWFVNTVEWLDK